MSALDKATDKIIDNMTPEELAKYVSEMSLSQAKRVSAGEITSEEAYKQSKLFSHKHLTFWDTDEYIQYLKALCREQNIYMMKALGEEHLRYIDSEINSSELIIVAFNITRLLCDDQGGVSVETALKYIEKCVEEHSKKISRLKEERAKFLNHERWNALGVHPDIKKREDLLPGTNVHCYAPEK
ncbi:hypothetical protein [uncultured Methanomethylovorans sp.]|uniref:hypothetical protein n=1 Tax=uncultured Methanomethylovorans sp. TaxID=183759 RepID=UPI0026371D30|nr:hypothetical protein [uncultured Methanomethylovorans sp.]